MANFVFTDTVLGNAGVYTGAARLRERHDTLTGIVKSDQNGTLLVQQSIDGTNWDFETSISVTGGTGKEINVTLYAPYWRIKYTNGATPQTSFRLSVTTQAGGDS